MNEDKNKQLFLSLIYSFQMQAMMQMGKLQNPMTGEIENELEAAQVTIDMLDMLKEKSKNNISEDESGFLTKVISDLKLNYVEELSKNKSEKEVHTGNENEPKANISPEQNNGAETEEKSEEKANEQETKESNDKAGEAKESAAKPDKSEDEEKSN